MCRCARDRFWASNRAPSLRRDDPSLRAYVHRLLSVSEHNQGFGTQHYPANIFTTHGNWSNQDFYAVRARADYQFLESSWKVGRDYLDPLTGKGGNLGQAVQQALFIGPGP